jgi:hypothetical protein
LLKAIDTTVDWLCNLQRQYRDWAEVAARATESLNACRLQHQLDPDGEVADLLEKGEQSLAVLKEVLSGKRHAAEKDRTLTGENKEAVIFEYDQAISACVAVHDATVELRWALLEHDADLDQPSDKAHSDVKELIRDLNG